MLINRKFFTNQVKIDFSIILTVTSAFKYNDGSDFLSLKREVDLNNWKHLT